MKIDRRSFLSFVIGGAAGTALSPLPWKITDDLSIWSQNWPWTPIPARGEASYVTSTCTLCPGGCGISVRKIDERVVKIEGLPDHPVNDGGVCTLGAAGTQLLYSPTRVTTPLKKVNGNWRRISWEDAISEVAAKLGDLRSKGLPHSLACICGSDRGTVPELFKRFLTVYGSPNFLRTPSMQDQYELSLFLSQGARATAGFDLANADYILSFGTGLVEGWGSPVYMFRSKSQLRERDGKMDQVEPRLSKTAAKSNDWIAINPGTEGVLALGLAYVIIEEKLYDREFVDQYSGGIDQFKQLLANEFTPKNVSDMTGIDAGVITKLARRFAKADKPLAICGRGAGITPGALQDYLAVHALNALVGNINQPGGVFAVPESEYIEWPDVEMDAAASEGMQQARLDEAGSDDYPHSRYLLNRLPKVINASQASPIEVLFVSGADPLYAMPDTASVKKAFEKIPMVVSFSSYLDETAASADLILPNHVFLERFEDVPTALGYPKPIIGLAQPVVEPLFNTQHTGDVIIQLAQEMGDNIAAAFAWDSYEACLEETLSDNWDTMLEQGYWTDDDFQPSGWADAFETDSGKFEFSNKDIAALPAYRPVKVQGDESSYNLLLIPYDTMRLASRNIGSPPFLVKSVEDFILQNNDVLIEVNPETARELGLPDGKVAVLSTPKGTARVKVRHFNGIMKGVVALPRGLGHTTDKPFLAGKGVNINQLMGSVSDPASGLDAAWGIRAKLTKA